MNQVRAQVGSQVRFQVDSQDGEVSGRFSG